VLTISGKSSILDPALQKHQYINVSIWKIMLFFWSANQQFSGKMSNIRISDNFAWINFCLKMTERPFT
jgi:hypothetical protein